MSITEIITKIKKLLGKKDENNIDYYDILRVPKNASQKDIQKSFRKLARKCHPDLNHDDPDATKKFTSLAEAYNKLRTEEKRNEVDAQIISEYCMSYLQAEPQEKNKKPSKKKKSDFLQILKG